MRCIRTTHCCVHSVVRIHRIPRSVIHECMRPDDEHIVWKAQMFNLNSVEPRGACLSQGCTEHRRHHCTTSPCTRDSGCSPQRRVSACSQLLLFRRVRLRPCPAGRTARVLPRRLQSRRFWSSTRRARPRPSPLRRCPRQMCRSSLRLRRSRATGTAVQ